MKTLILGAGQVGSGIARYLAHDENVVTVVDKDKKLLDSLVEKIDVQVYEGFASHPELLKSLQIEEYDVIVAVTSSDEINIIACEVAKSLNSKITSIARLRHREYYEHANNRNIAANIDVVISPEIEVAEAIGRNASVPGSFDVISLCNNKVKIIGVTCQAQSPILNTPIKLIPSLFPTLDLTIFCIKRDQDVFFPHEDEQLYEHDEVHFLVQADQLKEAMKGFGHDHSQERHMLIIGGGRIGSHLAKQMEEHSAETSVKIIERNPLVCEQIASFLERSEVLCGDALDYELLQDINLQNFETIISVTNDDKINILSALIAKKQAKARAITLLNNMAYSSLVHSLGIDSVVIPRALTISIILRHLQKGHIQSVNALGNDYLIVTGLVQENSFILGLTEEDVNIANKVKVLCCHHSGEIHMDCSKIIFGHGDEIIIVTTKDALKKVETLFSERPDYL